jgi:hypothetical protein
LSKGHTARPRTPPIACCAARPVSTTRSPTRCARYFSADIIDQAIAFGPGLHTRRGWLPAPASAGDAVVRLDDLIDWHTRMAWVAEHG